MATGRKWAEDGAEAFARAVPGSERGYRCPLCLRVVTEDRELTVEHAPPQSLGGGRVALTCTSCNSQAGHSVDAEMHRAQEVRDWAHGNQPNRLPAHMTLARRQLNVEVARDSEGVRIYGLPGNNSPVTMQQHLADLEDLEWDGERFSFTFHRHSFDRQRVAVGWLRSAYLIAFAALGYRYILSPQLKPVRRQIEEPDNTHIARFLVEEDGLSTAKTLMLVREPSSLECVLVRMGPRFVFLPGIGNHDIYEELRLLDDQPAKQRFEVRGQLVPWPEGPQFLFDR